MKAPFPIDPVLTQIAVAWMNRRFIADDVSTRFTVARQEFSYRVMNNEERFTIPDTNVGRASRPNEIEFGWTEVAGATRDRGLEDPIPQADIINDARGDVLSVATEGLTELIALDREKRVADQIGDQNTYLATQRTQLAGGDQWSAPATSDPIDDIMTGLDKPIMRPNVMALNQKAFTSLRTHPDIVTGVRGVNADAGIVTRQELAVLFDLDEVLVGEARYNSAKKGQTVTYVDLWGPHCTLFYRDRAATGSRGATFAATAQWGGRIAGSQPDRDIGLRGGQRVRVGESVVELILSADMAYFIEDCVA